MENKRITFKSVIKYVYDRYLIQAMGSMALGLFSSLIIGLILSQIAKIPYLSFFGYASEVLAASSPVVGSAIGVAIAYGMKAKPLTMFSCAATGALGYSLGGPVGAYLAAVVSSEAGRLVAGKTKVDIVVTPMVVIVAGSLVARFIGPAVSSFMTWLGGLINSATVMEPIPMGIIVATVVGLALTAPISSAALCIMLGLHGPAAGAAAVGCCAQMVGFAVASFKDNGWGGVISQGLGTSMLQISNILRKPAVLIAPTLTGAILGPISSAVLGMTNTASGAGMGTSGLVGQFGAWQAMVEESGMAAGTALFQILLMHVVAPAVICLAIHWVVCRLGWVKPGDMLLIRNQEK